MLRLRSRLSFVAAGTAVVTLGLVGAGTAQATGTVVSDTIQFSGTGAPGSTPGNFSITSSSCSLKSDGESNAITCRAKANATVSSSGVGGKFSVASVPITADGAINGTYTLTPAASPNTYNMTGTGAEKNYERGKLALGNNATLTGVWTITPSPSGITVSGSVTVSEPSTAP
jgi:hypothetical protein